MIGGPSIAAGSCITAAEAVSVDPIYRAAVGRRRRTLGRQRRRLL